MLTHIYVKNFVLIDQVALDFSDGMSVFTGETGAGKSLLIDAISLLCGERASAGYVKKGCAKAVIEGVFDIHDDARANALLREQGFDLDGEDLIVSREISAEGKSTIRIAQRTCTAAFLRELMSGLVDIHSQHDNQYLLQPRYHLSCWTDTIETMHCSTRSTRPIRTMTGCAERSPMPSRNAITAMILTN